MLKSYKNQLYAIVQRSGLEIGDFDAKDVVKKFTEETALVLVHRPTGLTFTAYQTVENGENTFRYEFTAYTGRSKGKPFGLGPYPEDGLSTLPFDNIATALTNWLDQQVRISLEERLLPDLWHDAREMNLPVLRGETFDDSAGFTEEEKIQIRLAVSTFRVLIVQNFGPTEEQMKAITERLDYLVAAVDRLNKFDWQGTVINTLLSISVTLSLDVATGRQLYGLFKQAFLTIRHLIGQ